MTRNHLRFAATVIFLLLSCCAPLQPPATPTGPIDLALVAWNLNAGRGDVGRLVDDLSSGRLTAGPVRDYVLLLQEAVEGGDRDIAAFARARSLHLHFAPVRPVGPVLSSVGPVLSDRPLPGRSGNAILSTRPLEAPRVITLPRERQPRAAAAADVEIAGQRLFVVSVHLENRLSWRRLLLFADNARGRQASALMAALPEGPGIVGGDMNTILGPREPAWRLLLERFPDTPAGRSSPTLRDRLVLDHLFFDVPDGWRATRRVLPDAYGSDHHPVLGDIRRER